MSCLPVSQWLRSLNLPSMYVGFPYVVYHLVTEVPLSLLKRESLWTPSQVVDVNVGTPPAHPHQHGQQHHANPVSESLQPGLAQLRMDSPPEAAIEATPESTPFVTPVKVRKMVAIVCMNLISSKAYDYMCMCRNFASVLVFIWWNFHRTKRSVVEWIVTDSVPTRICLNPHSLHVIDVRLGGGLFSLPSACSVKPEHQAAEIGLTVSTIDWFR